MCFRCFGCRISGFGVLSLGFQVEGFICAFLIVAAKSFRRSVKAHDDDDEDDDGYADDDNVCNCFLCALCQMLDLLSCCATEGNHNNPVSLPAQISSQPASLWVQSGLRLISGSLKSPKGSSEPCQHAMS